LPAWPTRLWPTVLDIIANRSIAMLLSCSGVSRARLNALANRFFAAAPPCRLT
jgi:hypothetical protein